MHPFIEMISKAGGVVAAITGAIIVLTIFFRSLNWLAGDGSPPETLAVRGILKKDTLVTVHVGGGETFERVRFIGFTRSDTVKAHLPHELSGMVILEDAGGTRFLVRAKNIRMIVVPPAVNSSRRD